MVRCRWYLLVVIQCVSVCMFSGCPNPHRSPSEEYCDIVTDESRSENIGEVKCTLQEMRTLLQIIAKKNDIPIESKRHFRNYVKNELRHEAIVGKDDAFLLFGVYKGEESSPMWGHLLIVNYDRNRKVCLVRVARQAYRYGGERFLAELYDFDWASAIKRECQIRGFTIIR